MTRATLDSNVLVYAALEPQTSKGRRANDVIIRAAARGILAAQALLEFVAVVRRRAPQLTSQAIAQAEAWTGVFETAPTNLAVMREALSLVANHGFQIWDAVIWSAAQDVGADLMLSEDLQDGLVLNGVRNTNPFALSDRQLDALLPP